MWLSLGGFQEEVPAPGAAASSCAPPPPAAVPAGILPKERCGAAAYGCLWMFHNVMISRREGSVFWYRISQKRVPGIICCSCNTKWCVVETECSPISRGNRSSGAAMYKKKQKKSCLVNCLPSCQRATVGCSTRYVIVYNSI